MRTSVLAILLIYLVPPGPAFADEARFELRLNYVMPVDEVRFNLASDVSGQESPNVLSDLEWDDMEIHRVHLNLRYRVYRGLSVFAEAELGAIEDGDVQDSDFAGDNRTQEFSRSTATVDGKHHTGGSVGVSWKFSGEIEVPLFPLPNGKRLAFATDYAITPSIGYAHTQQEIRFVDGVQVIPDLGPFDGLRSEYKAEWRGAFVGLDAKAKIFRNVHVSVGAKYHADNNFKGIGTWNLRSDLQQPTSFSDTADAKGIRLKYGLDWDISDNKTVNISYHVADFETDPGSAEVNTIFGISLFTRLNEASWKSRGWSVGFNWRF